ncbi:hypothetical protein SARC_07287 [Sphaeroforma arctica JP610]|uniref:Uncharacterized protein n=1 Tax=Sphaeroforma arctica JP610 TaxID=667725 RepID=A0A0L0FU45_9EUKA|nr:hypothetical protein SARC_07287 [Sphaeroforma arctica JP610]KNC80352.1 hypothetical protein SARC_07287 [Sphaeroforma arctica JP610]|eukprot:XP_014154254.1 hypothetical protein SARC_07287 [Sphaeroforma arctica JP610]
MLGQVKPPTKTFVTKDSLPNDQWKLDLQKSITDLSAQVNTLQANLNQMSGPALPNPNNDGPISKKPLADDQWKSTMHQMLTKLCVKVNNLESELRDLKLQTCAPLNEGTPHTIRIGSTSPPAPPAKIPRPKAPNSSSEPPSYCSKVDKPAKPSPKKGPTTPASQPLLQPPVPTHLLTKVMGRPMPDKTFHKMDDVTPVTPWAVEKTIAHLNKLKPCTVIIVRDHVLKKTITCSKCGEAGQNINTCDGDDVYESQ